MPINSIYLKKLDDKLPADNGENKTKLMYTCARKNQKSSVGDLIGLAVVLSICFYAIYKVIINHGSNRITDFAKNQEVFKMLIGLMLLTNIKNLNNSIANNIVLPLVEPVLPFLSCGLNLTYGPFALKLGNFATDTLVFTLNLFVTYLIFMVLS